MMIICLLLFWTWILLVTRACQAPMPFETMEEFQQRRAHEITRKTCP